MHVIATAGHVDHGKSTLVRALTGTDPDRLKEEQRRGLSIELGFCWTSLPGVGEVAFVDVPGHEHFISTMLAGVGPVPAVLFVVAADDNWMPQAAEHLAALEAFGVHRGILVVTRSDLADPTPAMRRARAEIDKTGLAGIPALAWSARTGAGLADIRMALVTLASGLSTPQEDSDVRLWIDRRFHVRGSGTVVTGTLAAGTIRVGDTLLLDGVEVRVRTLQALGRAVGHVSGVARVALNLSGRMPASLGRGSFLVTPDRWPMTREVDARLSPDKPLPRRPVLHVGAASVSVQTRSLAGNLARLRLERPLPLRIGDRGLLRDPGSRSVWGVTVLAPDPPSLRRRGAVTERARQLNGLDGTLGTEVAVRGWVRADQLSRFGIDVDSVPADVLEVDGWLVSRERTSEIRAEIEGAVRARATELQPGVPVAAVAQTLNVPAPLVLAIAAEAAAVRQIAGQLFVGHDQQLPARVTAAWEKISDHLGRCPFDAPNAACLADLGLDRKSMAALGRAGLALCLDEQIVLLHGADVAAARRLADLQQPFTLSDARQALRTSRRVAVPLLEHLDRSGLTIRHADNRRTVRGE